jgi:hypothetical protein
MPFRRFRVHLTTGVAFEVRHPEEATVYRDRLALRGAGPAGTGPPQLIDISLLHIVYIEATPVPTSPSAN